MGSINPKSTVVVGGVQVNEHGVQQTVYWTASNKDLQKTLTKISSSVRELKVLKSKRSNIQEKAQRTEKMSKWDQNKLFKINQRVVKLEKFLHSGKANQVKRPHRESVMNLLKAGAAIGAIFLVGGLITLALALTGIIPMMFLAIGAAIAILGALLLIISPSVLAKFKIDNKPADIHNMSDKSAVFPEQLSEAASKDGWVSFLPTSENPSGKPYLSAVISGSEGLDSLRSYDNAVTVSYSTRNPLMKGLASDSDIARSKMSPEAREKLDRGGKNSENAEKKADNQDRAVGNQKADDAGKHDGNGA